MNELYAVTINGVTTKYNSLAMAAEKVAAAVAAGKAVTTAVETYGASVVPTGKETDPTWANPFIGVTA